MLFAPLFAVCAFLCGMTLAQSTPKSVFAHFIIGNTYSSNYSDWLDDIQKAKDAHIDGFALNIAPSVSYTTQSLDNAYQAADQLGNFTMFLSFDYLSSGPWPASSVVQLINTYKGHSSQAKVDGKPIVSTFEGVGNVGDWPSIKSQVPIFFMPSWTSLGAPAVASDANVDGALPWASWPEGATDMTPSNDEYWKQLLGASGKALMMAVSPWFYTNIPQWDKNWLWRGDDLWYDRWQQVLEVQPAFVEILTWNDYGESHYIGPIRPGIPAGAEEYVDAESTPHDHWRDMLPHYIDAYKNGNTTMPPVEADKLSFWYRLTPTGTCSTGGTTGNTASQGQPVLDPNTVVQDKVFVDALVKSAATVTVQIGSGAVTTLQANHAGVNHFSVPLNGQLGAVTVTVRRDGQTTASGTGNAIEGSCPSGKMNYNAFVGGSS